MDATEQTTTRPLSDVGPWYTREANVSFVGQGEDRTVKVVASTEGEDSHGTVLRNWDLSRYQKNPTVLFAHNRDAWPIGRAPKTEQQAGKLMAVLEFAPASLNPEGERALQMFRAEMVRAVSVGFCQGPNTKVFTEAINGRNVVVIDAPQLAEISVLPVGSNEDALAAQNVRAIAQQWLAEQARSFGASTDEKRAALGAAIRTKYPPADTMMPGPFIRDLFDTEVVFEQGRGGPELWEAPYSYDTNTQVAEIGDAYRVRCSYTPLKGKGRSRSADTKDQTMAHENPESATLETKLQERDAMIKDLSTREAELRAELDVFKARNVALEERSAKAEAQVADLNRQLAVRDLDDLVGKKITPAEKDAMIELRALSTPLYEKHLAAVKGKPDMPQTKQEPSLPSAELEQRSLGSEDPEVARAHDVLAEALSRVA